MDKITREELMKKLNLTEEEQEKVAGGYYDVECGHWCIYLRDTAMAGCLADYDEDDYRYRICVIKAQNIENECQSECFF